MNHDHDAVQAGRPDNNSKLVMVCGAARSGTTMLDLMLGNSDDAFSTGEIVDYFRPYRTHHFNPVCSCGAADCKVWQGLLNVPESQFHANILKESEFNFVVDSSKDLRWVLDSNVWAQRNEIPCENVLIWKDPVDLAYSYWKRGNGIRWYRQVFLVYYARFLSLNLPFISVNYNQLAAEPKDILAKLCARLGMDYDEGRINFWEKHHHYYFGSAGIGRQVSNGGSQIQNKRDFPQDFVEEYKAESHWSESNEQFSRIINALEAHDVSGTQTFSSCHIRGGLRPLWYYRHIIKSIWRKRFPETRPVAD